MSQHTDRQLTRTITLEEHFNVAALPSEAPGGPANRAWLLKQLHDLGQERIAAMDAAGIDMQVVSLTTPGLEQLDADRAIPLATEINNGLAEAVQRHPDRLAGFAALPTTAPNVAADELERAVKELGLKGAMICGHVRGRYLDDEFFWPILERAAALAVPIYLHPTPPPQAVIDTYYTGNFTPDVTRLLAASAWGWHIETAIHILRIILSGAFDRYPNLQMVIGHQGEGLPFMMPRIEASLSIEVTRLQRPLGSYFRENLYYTFGGFNWTSMFVDLLSQVGIERIMFSADHPYQSMEKARTFLENLPISATDKELIAHGNAERFFHL
jgi:uncharacterized protein